MLFRSLYYAREDTRRPFNYAIVSLVVNAVIAFALMPVIGYLAAALGTTLSSWAMVWQLWRGTRSMGEAASLDSRFRRRVPLVFVSSAVMGLVLWGLMEFFGTAAILPGQRLGILLLLILAGAVSYFATVFLTGAMGVKELKSVLRRRKS